MLEPNRERIERALQLFGTPQLGQPHSLTTAFECLGAEILVRHAMPSQLPSPPTNLAAQGQLARLFSYASLRLTDVFIRRGLVEFVRSQFASVFGEDAAGWYSFGALCIKDFHTDLGSLMDAVAPVILQACDCFDAQGEVRFPGFADIQRGTKRTFRSSLPTRVLETIDATEAWWPDVKLIRDTLTHREHHKIAFGGPAAGVLFQVYAPALSPKVVHPAFLWPTGQNVADFRRYSAYVLAEVLVFLEELGVALAEHLRLSRATLISSFRAGDFADVIDPLRDMLEGGVA